jgi:hypothetical protein
MTLMRASFVLDADGSSDRALVPLLDLLVRGCAPDLLFDIQWVDPTRLKAKSRAVVDRLERTLRLFPATQAVFLHRDSEKATLEERTTEIADAWDRLQRRSGTAPILPIVPVVPVRMQEAWLLVSEQAIREAVGRPMGKVHLDLPALHSLEGLPDPKTCLYDLLRTASEATGRRAKSFRPTVHAVRVADYINELSALRQLPAFAVLEQRVRELLGKLCGG